MPRPDYDAFRARAHFGSLDGLRCLAIVPVVWHHATPRPLEGVLGRGPLGVDLFFVVSGFLITTLLFREQAARGRIDLVAFYVRRALRIFPLYFAVLGLYVAHALVVRDPGDPIRAHFLDSVPWYATYTANWLVRFDVPHPVAFGFAWSLSTEEQFYAVWPSVLLVAGLAAARFRRAMGLALPACVALGLVALDHVVEGGGLTSALPPGGLARRVVTSIATPIGLGSLAALALAHRGGFAGASRLLGSRSAAPLAASALAACVVLPAPPLPTFLAMTALVVAATLREDHLLAPLLTAPPIARIGVVSYGIYLLHVSAITAVKAALPAVPTWLLFPASFALAWALAELSFRWFERPFLRLKSRLQRHRAAAHQAYGPLDAPDRDASVSSKFS